MRSLLATLAAGLLLAPAVAADDPPKGGGTVQMLLVKIDGDKLVSTTSSQLNRSVTVMEKDGSELKPKTVTVTETISTTTARELKYLKATDTDDKEIPAADFKDKLKGGGQVVWLNSPLDPTWKAKFKKGTVFVEYTAPKEEKKDDEKKPDDKKDDKKPVDKQPIDK